MRGNSDVVKGRVKQAIGAITGDETLKRDGRNDDRTGRIKQKTGKAIDAVRDKLEGAATTLTPGEKER